MPRISEFFGITILMYYRDHAPPHFHAQYQDHEAAVDIRTLGLLEGRLPPRQLGLVVEWAAQHQGELGRVWEQARAMQALDRIDGLA